MASSSTSPSAASSSSTQQWKYDVFLSFRGEDTRKSFTAHLYAELCRYGIDTFRDDQLRRGQKISPALLQAIEESRFSIIILSENYASSSWCLDELTKILECVKVRGHTALPVFYNMDPSHVRKQKRSFAEAFAKHEQVYREKMEEVAKWRKALSEAATISGWDTRNRNESEVIEEIVTRILNEPINASSINMDALVGMDSRIKDMLSLLCIGSDDVRMVGIWGMGGIGKTSLAEAAYERIRAKFEGCCFLENIGEDSQRRGLTYLKEQLISQILGRETKNFNLGINFIKAGLHSRKVLIVLDDVHNLQQLQALAGDHDWFGHGSRIIITTRDKGLLNRVDATYEVEELARDEAHKLFCLHAFVQNSITEDYKQLCNDVVHYANGLPLALIVLGSFLRKKDKDEWKSALDKLRRIPHQDVHKKLKISFDGLDHTQKEIFLDIACFFKGGDRSFVEEILESTDCFPVIDIRVLIDKSLITVSNNKLYMHDLLQEMGWEIVRQEDVRYPGKRSRLWVHDEVSDVLTTNMQMKKLKFIKLSYSQHLTEIPDFSGAPNLRQLILNGCTSLVEVHPSIGALKQLIFLNLEGCKQLKSFPSSIHMESLQNLIFSGCLKLEKFPEVQGNMEHLTELSLEGTAIKGFPLSIENLTGLAFLNLKECKRLKSLPRSIFKLESLKTLILSNCARLEKLPEMLENKESLKELFLDGSGIREVPSSIGLLKGLVLLNLSYCKKLASLPQSICELTSLRTLTLCGCSELTELPDELGSLQCLVELNADGTAIREIPPSINLLTNLQVLSLAGCKGGESKPRNRVLSFRSSPTLESFRLPSLCALTSLKNLILSDCNLLEGALPSDLSFLSSLEHLDLSRNNFITLPASLSRLAHLNQLILAYCKSLQSLIELPSSIVRLDANDCTSLKTFPYPSSAYALMKSGMIKSGMLTFEFSNCLQLVKNEESDIVEAILLGIRLVASGPKYLGADNVFRRPHRGYNATLPGSNIPEWFIHQSMGSSVTVELPPHWYNSKLMGLAVCAVVDADPAVPPLETFPGFVFFSLGDGGPYIDQTGSLNFSLKADHVWFGYRPIGGLHCWDENKVRNQGNTFKVSFATYWSEHANLKVKRCGVRVVYEEDENDGECSFPYAPMLPRGDESESESEDL